MDDEGLTYKDTFTFRAENPKEVKREEILKERIKCKEKDCNGYELLTEECLDTHINYHHRIQDFKEDADQ